MNELWIWIILGVVLIGGIMIYNKNFSDDCRELGGVPVINSNGSNVCYPKGVVIDMRDK